MSFAFTTLAALSMTSLIPSGIVAVISTLISAGVDSFFADFVTTTDFGAGRLRGAAFFATAFFFAGSVFAAALFAGADFFLIGLFCVIDQQL